MSHREKDDDYDHVIAQLGPSWRVVVCKDDYQWITQQKIGKIWRSRHYHTARDGVLYRVQGLPGWESLKELPERFTTGSRTAYRLVSDGPRLHR